MGFFSSLWSGIKHHVGNVWNEIKQRGTTLLTNSHYIGPFNALSPEYLKSHPPTDNVDASALHHDLDYSRIAKQRDTGKASPEEAKKLIRESDERFLGNVKKHYHENKWGGALGYAGIWAKNRLEDLGILNPNQFVTQKLGGLIRSKKFRI